MSDLDRLDFFDLVLAEASTNGLPPASISLELTETGLASGTRATMEIISRLRLKRVTMSIDDFGTGQTSLAQLRDQPFNQLKIDGSFVRGASTNATQDVILASSIKMARHLGMKTVGEGVDDRADWEWLRRSGCDLAQGHFIARPMPAAELMNWTVEWEKRRRELFRT
jgi:EAL domain-containing protein (putative c-di-GMP-specific phosphodiesterase class I)